MKLKGSFIDYYEIDSGHPGPKVLITAGVHGDEYEPMLACLRLRSVLPGLVRRGKVILVPVVNQSAFTSGSRAGTDGLDLARICPGNDEGTPSELAAAEVSSLIREADYLIDLHTGGRLLDIFPLAGYMLHASSEILRIQRGMAEAFNLPVVWGTDDKLDGRTLSVARDAGVPAIYVEYGGGGAIRNGIVDAYVEGCQRVLGYLEVGETVNAGASRLKYRVEDATPDAGYLQRKMPASVAGIFLPELSPGDLVEKGKTLGRMMTLPDGGNHPVFAESDGLVLFLRVAGYVREGEALGGILNLTEQRKI